MAQSKEYLNNYSKVYRRKQKQLAFDYKGGACQMCGIADECLGIYDFHHIDPETKDATIASFKCFKTAKKELDKCILVCSNCHRKIHYGDD